MPAPKIPAVALGGLLIAVSPAWGRAGPPSAGVQPAVANTASAPAIPAVPAGTANAIDPAALARFYGIDRDGDAQMDCAQLNAELQSLAVDIAKLPPQPDWAALADGMRPKVNPNVVGAGHMAASAVLSRVPVFGGVLAAVSERPPGTSAREARLFAQVQQAQQVSIDHAVLHARRARVTQLFQARGCKVSDFDPRPVLESAPDVGASGAAAATSAAPEPSDTRATPAK